MSEFRESGGQAEPIEEIDIHGRLQALGRVLHDPKMNHLLDTIHKIYLSGNSLISLPPRAKNMLEPIQGVRPLGHALGDVIIFRIKMRLWMQKGFDETNGK